MNELRSALADPDASIRMPAATSRTVGAPERLVGRAVSALGHLDVLVCNHASSGPDAALGGLDADLLDAHWAITRVPRCCSRRRSQRLTTAGREGGSCS